MLMALPDQTPVDKEQLNLRAEERAVGCARRPDPDGDGPNYAALDSDEEDLP